jgi:predicted RNA-binding Zn-ribbon protein involved in translation (DUF1610 family)
MQYILIALVIAVLCVFGLSCRKSTPSNSTGGEPQGTVTIFSGKFLSHQEIQKQLALIARKPAPKKLAMGAMCYAVAVTSSRIDYVCPTCGEKMLYALEDSSDKTKRDIQWKAISDIQSLESLRRLAQQIKKLDISLNESQFCKHCHPDVIEPKLGLIVKYPDQPEPHCVWDVSWTDLVMIKAVTAGKLKYKDQQDREVALKDFLPRLKELLNADIDDRNW